MKYILTFLSAVILVSILTPLFRKLARRLNIMDVPAGIKAHQKPVPYLGGAAIYLAFVIPLVLVVRFGLVTGEGNTIAESLGMIGGVTKEMPALLSGGLSREMAALLAGGTLIALLGLIDDIKRLSFYIKFIVQVLAAIILILGGIRLTIEILPTPLNILFTIIWVVAITNAFNIIDVMDGLSSGVAFISVAIFFIIALLTDEPLVALMSAALAGSTLGFLGYNLQPATIFMGDAGSGFIGFILAAIAMGGSYTGRNDLALLSPILILGIPIYDTVLVSILRIRRRKPIFEGSSDHFALRLLAMGFSPRNTVLLAYSISLCMGIVTFIIVRVQIWWALALLIAVGILSLLAAVRLSRVEMKDSR